MGWFTPPKKANKFNYIPRFYDPVKEARELRRRELRGESVETDNAEEYDPGMYLRTQRDARAERRRSVINRGSSGKRSGLVIAAAVILVFIFSYMVVPRIMRLLSNSNRQTALYTYSDDFDPSAPITVVPNDWKDGDPVETE